MKTNEIRRIASIKNSEYGTVYFEVEKMNGKWAYFSKTGVITGIFNSIEQAQTFIYDAYVDVEGFELIPQE